MASASEIMMVTIVGIGVVFAVLILLALIIMGFRYLFYREPEKENTKETQVVPEEKEEDSGGINNEEELVAVIAAAIASMSPDSRFIVKSITRVPDTSPIWGRIARQEQINRY